MRTLIERGHVYASRPPLYRIKRKGEILYLKNDDELERYRQTHDMAGTDLSRFKGLGEMNPQQLAETVLDPRTRDVVRVTIEDAEAAARTVEALMGEDVEGRKNFLFNELQLADKMI
jgi:DNA gyrase subunit B